MICRSAVKPIFVGLGTAAILAAGGASAIADTPSPSDSGTELPPLSVTVSAVDPTVDADKSTTVVTTVSVSGAASGVKITDVDLKSSNAKVTPVFELTCTVENPCALEGLDGVEQKKKAIESDLSIKGTSADPVTVTVTLTVNGKVGDSDETGTDGTQVKFTPVKIDPPDETPSEDPTTPEPPDKDPPGGKPSDTPSGGSSGGGGSKDDGSKDSGSKDDGSSDGGSDDGGSGGGSGDGSSGDDSSGSGTDGYVPPNPNSSFDPQNPNVALPPIQAPSPSVAPSPGAVTPQSRLQGNKAPVAQDLTFERMASTQIAWLAALLVAFSLLLTQVRLGRRRLPAGAARRVKGTHRRPRRGVFGK